MTTIDLWSPDAPTAFLEEQSDGLGDVDRLRAAGKASWRSYSQALRDGPPISARASWARLIFDEGTTSFDPGDVAETDGGEVHRVPAPLELLGLPDLQRRTALLEVIHGHALTLARRRRWDDGPLHWAYRAALATGVSWGRSSRPKSSPDRRHRATASMEVDGAGDGWMVLTVTDRDGRVIVQSEPCSTDVSVRTFNAAARTLRWQGPATVTMQAWPGCPWRRFDVGLRVDLP